MAHGNNNMIGYRKISSTSFAFLSSAECLKSDDGQTDDFLIHSYLLQVDISLKEIQFLLISLKEEIQLFKHFMKYYGSWTHAYSPFHSF